jgi:hypothetical protein
MHIPTPSSIRRSATSWWIRKPDHMGSVATPSSPVSRLTTGVLHRRVSGGQPDGKHRETNQRGDE